MHILAFEGVERSRTGVGLHKIRSQKKGRVEKKKKIKKRKADQEEVKFGRGKRQSRARQGFIKNTAASIKRRGKKRKQRKIL